MFRLGSVKIDFLVEHVNFSLVGLTSFPFSSSVNTFLQLLLFNITVGFAYNVFLLKNRSVKVGLMQCASPNII